MKFILVPLVSLVVCQVIKLAILFYKDKRITFHKLIWEGFWVGKFPSSHAALLISTLYLVVIYTKNQSIIAFAFVVSLLFIYSLLEDKKRGDILETYLSKSNDTELKKISSDGILREFNGHTYSELIAGALIGLVVAVLLQNFF